MTKFVATRNISDIVNGYLIDKGTLIKTDCLKWASRWGMALVEKDFSDSAPDIKEISDSVEDRQGQELVPVEKAIESRPTKVVLSEQTKD